MTPKDIIRMHLRRKGLALLCALGLLLTGCEAFVAGIGAGVGVYTYQHGQLKRAYQSDYDRTVTATLDALKDLGINIRTQKNDGIQAQFRAQTRNRRPVTLNLKRVAPNVTEVSVRSGYVGVWDRQASETIHASIAQRLP
jgi:hypothetical protein